MVKQSSILKKQNAALWKPVLAHVAVVSDMKKAAVDRDRGGTTCCV